jgi:hypothetical protein
MKILRSLATGCVCLMAIATPAPAQFILNLSSTAPGTAQLSFSSEPGYYYCLESSTNLDTGFAPASGWLVGDGTAIAWDLHYVTSQPASGNPAQPGSTIAFSFYPFPNQKTLVTWTDAAAVP